MTSIRSTGTPARRADSRLPPIARTCRPKRVWLKSHAPNRAKRKAMITGTGMPATVPWPNHVIDDGSP